MQSTSDLLNRPVPQVRPAVAAKATARLAYLDTLRAILISLVIALHTAITYGALGGWPYRDPAQSEISGIVLTLVTTLVQAFSLGLYFFISGFFTPGPYDRKGIGRFWKDRLLRLAIPLVIYTWALNRVPNYFAAVASHGETRSFWAYFAQTFLSDPEEGPTWFIFALLAFYAGYTLWRLATRIADPERLGWISRLKTPGKREILGFGVLVGALMFVLGLASPINETIEAFGIFSLMTIFFVQYILFYIAGVLAYRNDWLKRLEGKDLRFWSWLSLGLVIMVPVMMVVGGATSGAVDSFLGGLHWQSVMFMLWVGVFSVSISMTLLLWLRDRKAPQSRVMAFAGPNSYGVYLIHPLVLVPLAVAFTPLAIPPLLKFAIVLPLTVALSFLISEGLRRLPGVKAIL